MSITSGGVNGEDRLDIEDQGIGPGQIDTLGLSVRFEGAVIGTAVGGANGAPLTITFNTPDATPAAVEALVRAITYQNANENDPAAGDRNVRFVLTDSAGVAAPVADVTVDVLAVNDAPTISFFNQTLSYVEGAGPIVLDTLNPALIADVDSADFADGSMTVRITGGGDPTEDVLAIQSQSPGTGRGRNQHIRLRCQTG